MVSPKFILKLFIGYVTSTSRRPVSAEDGSKKRVKSAYIKFTPAFIPNLLKEGRCSARQKRVLEFCPSWFAILSCSAIKQQVGTYFHQIAISFFSHTVPYLIIIKI